MKKLVSIIVSIYNEEKYIDKSGYIIDSLMEKAIEWIYLETNQGIKRMNLKPGEEPIAYFALLEGEKVIKAYSYCNLHGLWVKEN